MERSATVTWNGSLKEGRGLISTKSRALLGIPYTFNTRFKDVIVTNPEELIAAAHASCFSMALTSEAGKENFSIESIHTVANVTMEFSNNIWAVNSSHLDVLAEIPGMSESKFQSISEKAKENCPISRLLNTKISMHARIWSKDRIISTSPPPGEI